MGMAAWLVTTKKHLEEIDFNDEFDIVVMLDRCYILRDLGIKAHNAVFNADRHPSYGQFVLLDRPVLDKLYELINEYNEKEPDDSGLVVENQKDLIEVSKWLSEVEKDYPDDITNKCFYLLY